VSEDKLKSAKRGLGTEEKTKRSGKPLLVFAIVIGVASVVGIAAVIIGLSQGPQYTYETLTLQKTSLDSSLMTSGIVKSASSRNIYAPSTLPILSLNVKEGDEVKQDDVLAALDISTLQLDIKNTQLAIESAQAALSNTKRANKNVAANTANSVTAAQADLDTATRNYNDLQAQLYAVYHSDSSDVIDDSAAAAAVRSARADLDLAERNNDALIDTLSDNAMIASAKADLDAAKARYNGLISGSGDYAVEDARVILETAQLAYDAAVLGGDQAAILQAKAALGQAQLGFDTAQATLSANTASALLTMQKAQAAYDNAAKTLGDTLAATNTALEKAQITYDNALKTLRDNVRNASSSMEKAQAAYNIAVSNSVLARGNNTDINSLSIEQQEILLQKQQKTLSDSTITAPISGTVTFVQANVGQTASGLMFIVENTDDLIVSTSLNESDIGAVKVGQNVLVITDATSGESIEGTVSHISSAAQKTAAGAANNTSAFFTVEVKINKPDDRIKIGMNARLTITTEHKEGVFAVPVSAIRKTSEGSCVQVVEQSGNGYAQPRLIPVQTGIETASMVEIISDQLSDGMLIVTQMKAK
jgi:HlyD family secretion protein